MAQAFLAKTFFWLILQLSAKSFFGSFVSFQQRLFLAHSLALSKEFFGSFFGFQQRVFLAHFLAFSKEFFWLIFWLSKSRLTLFSPFVFVFSSSERRKIQNHQNTLPLPTSKCLFWKEVLGRVPLPFGKRAGRQLGFFSLKNILSSFGRNMG